MPTKEIGILKDMDLWTSWFEGSHTFKFNFKVLVPSTTIISNAYFMVQFHYYDGIAGSAIIKGAIVLNGKRVCQLMDVYKCQIQTYNSDEQYNSGIEGIESRVVDVIKWNDVNDLDIEITNSSYPWRGDAQKITINLIVEYEGEEPNIEQVQYLEPERKVFTDFISYLIDNAIKILTIVMLLMFLRLIMKVLI